MIIMSTLAFLLQLPCLELFSRLISWQNKRVRKIAAKRGIINGKSQFVYYTKKVDTEIFSLGFLSHFCLRSNNSI